MSAQTSLTQNMADDPVAPNYECCAINRGMMFAFMLLQNPIETTHIKIRVG